MKHRQTGATNITETTKRKNESLGIANEMSEQVKKQDRQFLGANTTITARQMH